MKPVIFSVAAVAMLLSLASCGGGSNQKLNEDLPATDSSKASGAAPAAPSVADFKVDLSADHVASGHGIYHTTCAPCHGEGGKGDGPAAIALNPKPRDHTNGVYMDKLTNAHIFDVITKGGAAFGYPTMPGQPQLADDSVKNVIAYVRSLSKTYKQ